MITLSIAIASFFLYLLAYHTYGKWLGRKIFGLDASNIAPSKELEDGVDFVPTSKSVVFGHHFTSIAGTGPIVGPALAVIWGWVPAVLWVIFGSIFIGAVHDFGSLVLSMRNRGQTVGDLAGRVLAPRARILFLLVLFLALTIVLAIFGLVIASVFRLYPAAIAPCLLQIPLAIGIGTLIHRKGGKLLPASIAALALMYLSVVFGDVGWLAEFNATLANWSIFTWVVVLLVYSYLASVLPVWILLQPRDYINSLQLLTALGLIVAGLFAAAFVGGPAIQGNAQALEIVAPAFESNVSAKQLPLIFPFLFVTIACGAVSGFHCLVSSGTSSKQLRCETDARFVGYGSMLTEGFLAIIVILACIAGLGLGAAELIKVDGKVIASGNILTGVDAFNNRYASWNGAGGLAAKVGAFVDGSANFVQSLGLSAKFAIALMGVLVASFAATTLDTACRLQRYVVQEIAEVSPALKPLRNTHVATLFAIALAGIVASLPAPNTAFSLASAGKGGLILWPLFGATNQLLAGLAFLVILFWMRRRNLPTWFVAIPTVFMLILPAWAMVYQMFVAALGSDQSWLEQGNYFLVGMGAATLALEVWLLFEAAGAWKKSKGELEQALPAAVDRGTST